MDYATSKFIWIFYLFHQLEIKPFRSMHLWCDNQATIHIAKNLIFHEQTKHIKDCHFVRQKLQEGIIN